MKTDVILYRPMGDFEVQQRTKDGMFNATSLLEQWNKANPNHPRRLDKFWESTHLTELMSEIAENEMDFKSPNFGELKNLLSKTTRGRHNGGTWMHKYLFIKFAMYLSPKFEYSVIKFVYDQLIQHRHKAGDNYRLLTASASIFPNVNYFKIAQGLNWIVFNKHHKDIRNAATEAQMQELHQLEEKLAFAVDMGYINTFGQLMSEMRKIYHSKNTKF